MSKWVLSWNGLIGGGVTAAAAAVVVVVLVASKRLFLRCACLRLFYKWEEIGEAEERLLLGGCIIYYYSLGLLTEDIKGDMGFQIDDDADVDVSGDACWI